jgi:hypothetical protein
MSSMKINTTLGAAAAEDAHAANRPNDRSANAADFMADPYAEGVEQQSPGSRVGERTLG